MKAMKQRDIVRTLRPGLWQFLDDDDRAKTARTEDAVTRLEADLGAIWDRLNATPADMTIERGIAAQPW